MKIIRITLALILLRLLTGCQKPPFHLNDQRVAGSLNSDKQASAPG